MAFLPSKNKLFHIIHHKCSTFLHEGADRLKNTYGFSLSEQSASSLSLSSDFRFFAYACEVLHSASLSFAHGSQNPTLLPATQPGVSSFVSKIEHLLHMHISHFKHSYFVTQKHELHMFSSSVEAESVFLHSAILYGRWACRQPRRNILRMLGYKINFNQF